MTEFNTQKAEKLTIEEVAENQLEGNFLNDFFGFLEFLKEEKIIPKWKSINGFNADYKSKRVCSITLGTPGWLDDAIHKKNYVGINVGTSDWDFDGYLNEQSEEIKNLFIEQISHKCVHCRPTCGCSKMSGRSIWVSGKEYLNVCNNAHGYKFYSSGGDLSEMIMCTPRALYPPIEIRPVPMDTVKKLILARKEYITKILNT